ncbi:MAG: hypothetical protein NUV56_01800 [Candidatus Uhrbacteria bacterium]|nr:hypothetical protein [Candidatus Uhrbacteria bacterium]
MQGYELPDGSEVIIVNEIESKLEIIFITKRTLEIGDVASSELVGVHVFTKLSMSLPVAIYLNMLLFTQIMADMPVIDDTVRATRPIGVLFSEDRQKVTFVFMRPKQDADFDETGTFRKATINFAKNDDKLVVRVIITKVSARLLCDGFVRNNLKDVVLGALDAREALLQP